MIRRFSIAAIAALCLVAPARAMSDDNIKAGAVMLGMATFVESNCTNMRTNMSAAGDFMDKLGFDMTDPPYRLIEASSVVINSLKSEPRVKICRKIWETFGASGSAAKDIFIKR